MWKPGVQRKGLTERRRRRLKHDEFCRSVLEKVARGPVSSYARAAYELEKAGIRPRRGGDRWSRGQVWKMCKRLGLDMSNGRKFGDLPRCMGCHVKTGWQSSQGLCRRCNARATKQRYRDYQEWSRSRRFAEIRTKMAELQEELDALKAGRRLYTKRNPRPTHRFGKPVTYRLAGENAKRSGG